MDWIARINAAAQSEAALRAIATELDAERGDHVRPLQLRVAGQILQLRARQAAPAAAQRCFAAPFGISRVTGAYLYSYRLSDAAFAALHVDVTQRARAGRLGPGVGAALFVLWASEWFRRCYQGGGYEWRHLCEALGTTIDQNLLRRITADGLERWGRRPICGEIGRQFLITLAREGGFPAAAVARDAGGWAQEVLGRMVATLLTVPVIDTAPAIAAARSLAARVPASFRDDDFLTLCADLAVAIAQLRREFEPSAARAGLSLATWLTLNQRDWADALPIRVGEEGAATLVEALLGVAPAVGVAGAAQATRLLVRDDKGWRSAVRLVLDGAFDGDAMRGLGAELGRLRAFAGGAFARYLPGELALLEPPGDGESSWTGRSLPRGRAVADLPFAVPVELVLHAGERRAASVLLAGGKALRSRVIVCSCDAGTDDAPERLAVLGGPGRYRAAVVFALVPADWPVEAQPGHRAVLCGTGLPGTALWRIEGEARIRTPEGDSLRVRGNHSHDERERIELYGAAVHWATVSGDVDLFVGDVGWRPRGNAGGTLYRRALGERDWQLARTPLRPGHYELGWRDEGLLLDRRRIAVLPAEAQLSCSGTGQDARFALAGFADCTVVPAPDAPVQAISSSEWRHRPDRQPRHYFEAEARWEDGVSPPLAVRIACPVPAGIASWDGTERASSKPIALADLHDYVAHDRGDMILFAELYERNRRVPGVSAQWAFSNELPLGAVADDIASMLRPISIDAQVKLGMHDGIETYWSVRPFRGALRHEGKGVIADPAETGEDVTLCARALIDPTHEIDLGTYSLLSDANHRPAPLPGGWRGTWLLYLRKHGAVLTRPVLHHAGPLERAPGDALAAAMALAPPALDPALRAFLDRARVGEEPVTPLIQLAQSLNGLPPLTFRVFELAAIDFPELFARLAFEAGDAALSAVLDLSEALPFAWPLLPRDAWDAARKARFQALDAQLAPLGAESARLAWSEVYRRQGMICAAEPLLNAVFASAPTRPVRDIVQAFLNRSHQRIELTPRNIFREALGNALPGDYAQLNPDWQETLDAPFAAGLAALGHWRPGRDHVGRLKTLARRFPLFFAEAFAAALAGAA